MKSIVTIILILGIFTQSIGKLVLLSNYQLNKVSITLKYCENKSKPKLKCEGKCHLKKQLKHHENHENSSKKNIKNMEEVQYYSFYESTIHPAFFYFSTIPNRVELIGKTIQFSTDIFHPPTV